jgi:DNA-binding IclR family transcriptional regulator
MTQEAAVRSVGRGLRILGSFSAERSELSVGEIAAALDVHASTASRLAATLVGEGFLHRSARGGFRLGPEMVRLGLLAAGGETIVAAARGAMDELAARTGETVVVSVPREDEAVDVAQVDSRFLVGGTSWVGRALPLHATSDGKVFLAFGAAHLPEGALEPLTERTITDLARLARELALVRRQGWSPAIGECEQGLNGAAAPIFAGGGRCVAAISVSGPSYRLPKDRLAGLGAETKNAAAAVSVRLGWSPGDAERNGDRP